MIYKTYVIIITTQFQNIKYFNTETDLLEMLLLNSQSMYNNVTDSQELLMISKSIVKIRTIGRDYLVLVGVERSSLL